MIMDRKHHCRHSESDLHWQQNPAWNTINLTPSHLSMNKTGPAGKDAGIQSLASEDISQITRLKSGQHRGPRSFIYCWEMSKAEKISPSSKSSLALLAGKQDNITQK
jgi:hypothetical protein